MLPFSAAFRSISMYFDVSTCSFRRFWHFPFGTGVTFVPRTVLPLMTSSTGVELRAAADDLVGVGLRLGVGLGDLGVGQRGLQVGLGRLGVGQGGLDLVVVRLHAPVEGDPLRVDLLHGDADGAQPGLEARP